MKQQKLCDNCRERPAFFRVKGGPIKTDKWHTLCMSCHRNQRNHYQAQSKKTQDISSTEGAPTMDENSIVFELERHSVLNKLMTAKEVVFQGRDLPDPEDPSDPQFIAKIYISQAGAGSETIFGDRVIGNGIPSLMVPAWNRDNLSYLKHWLSKVLDDPKMYRANRIHIYSTEQWRQNWKLRSKKV